MLGDEIGTNCNDAATDVDRVRVCRADLGDGVMDGGGRGAM